MFRFDAAAYPHAVQVTIWSNGERPPSGWIAVEDQEHRKFVGWLELLRMLQEGLERGLGLAGPDTKSERALRTGA